MGKYDFGDLNPRTPRQNVREITGETTGIGYIRHGAINHNKRDVNKKKKEMLAQVLKVYDAPEDMKRSRAKSAFNFWGVFDVETSDDNVVTIKARIIESFGGACLPEPSEIPLNPKSEHYNNDLKIVDMYPKFVSFPGENGQLPPKPRAGQIVKVDFEDRINFVGGMYLGVLDNNELIGTINAGQQAGIGSKSKNSARDAVEGITPPPTPPRPSPPRQPPKPWDGETNGDGWFFPQGDIQYTKGAHGIETLAMVGGDPRIRAFMRMISIGEAGAHTEHGVGSDRGKQFSPYQLSIRGHSSRAGNVNTAKKNKYTKASCVGRLEFRNGKWANYNAKCGYFNGHPGVAVLRPRSNANGRYQYMDVPLAPWYGKRGWATYGTHRPGEPPRTLQEAEKDFSPGNQDWICYAFLTSQKGGRTIKNRTGSGWGSTPESLLELLESLGNSPSIANNEHLKIWKKCFDRPGKGVGKIWASLPYACYKYQSCYGLEGTRQRGKRPVKENGKIIEPGVEGVWTTDNRKFKKKLQIYGDMLQEELLISSQGGLVASKGTGFESRASSPA